MEREVEEADAGGRKRKRRVQAVEYCYEPELEGGNTHWIGRLLELNC